jgi:hypothetical protein
MYKERTNFKFKEPSRKLIAHTHLYFLFCDNCKQRSFFDNSNAAVLFNDSSTFIKMYCCAYCDDVRIAKWNPKDGFES